MRSRLVLALIAVAVTAQAQVRDTINFSSSTAPAPGRGYYSGGAPAAQQHHDAPAVTTTGQVDRFDFRVQERNLRIFNGGTRGVFRGGNWGTSFRGRGCYRGFCGNVGYFQNPYLYAVPVYVESYNGPDFNNQPSAYQVYGGEVPKEYQAPGADAVAAAYRQGHMDAQLEQRISSLADEVARLRAEKEERDRAAARQPDRSFADANTADGNESARGPANAATATLVFKNGTKLDIANYAVVGRTLWVFDEQRARKILLTDLDLDATHRANLANGYETRIPLK